MATPSTRSDTAFALAEIQYRSALISLGNAGRTASPSSSWPSRTPRYAASRTAGRHPPTGTRGGTATAARASPAPRWPLRTPAAIPRSTSPAPRASSVTRPCTTATSTGGGIGGLPYRARPASGRSRPREAPSARLGLGLDASSGFDPGAALDPQLPEFANAAGSPTASPTIRARPTPDSKAARSRPRSKASETCAGPSARPWTSGASPVNPCWTSTRGSCRSPTATSPARSSLHGRGLLSQCVPGSGVVRGVAVSHTGHPLAADGREVPWL